MKITAFLALSAVFLASPVLGHESFLDDEPESTNLRSQQQEQRELLFWKDQSYYEDIYYRCCNTCEDGENVAGSQSKNNPDWRHPDASAKGYGEGEICKCPKRGSTGKFWSSRSYFEKWQDACTGPNGSLYKKAGSPDAGTCPE